MKWVLIKRHKQCPFVVHCISPGGVAILAAHVMRAEYNDRKTAQSFVDYLNDRKVTP